MNLEDVRVFVTIVRMGSFTAAAEQLMLSKQYVSRRVAALEEALSVRLLVRNTRKLSVTDTGQDFYIYGSRILDSVFEAEQVISLHRKGLYGSFKISLPMCYGMDFLSPLIAEFLCHHPALQFQIELDDRYVDVIGEGFDMVLRIGSLADSTLIARPFGKLKMIICASPGYLQKEGTPSDASELLRHKCMRYGREGQYGWRLNINGTQRIFSVRGPVISNNGEIIRDAAEAGLGIALLPEFIVASCLQKGTLVAILPDCSPPPLKLNALYPQHREHSSVAKAFLAFLAEKLKGL